MAKLIVLRSYTRGSIDRMANQYTLRCQELQNPKTGEIFHTASAYLTMVALDDKGKAATIPAVLPETPEEKDRFQAAIERRKARLVLKEKLRANKLPSK